MSILNHPIPSNGQPLLPARSSTSPDSLQHLAMAPFNPSKNSSMVSLISDVSSNKIQMSQNGSLQGLKQYVWIDEPKHNVDLYSSSKPGIVLSVSISSAVKLDTTQIELIARKMQKLTGFVNLKVQNIVDPSLIAGFSICYGDDESNIIDLSVKGQLAALAARVESSEQRIADNV